MEKAQAIIHYMDMQMNLLRPEKTLTGQDGELIEYEIPELPGYRFTTELVIGIEDDEMPTFVQPQTEIKYQANHPITIELRYQKLPTAQPKRADAKQWVAQADHKFLVKSQQETIPVFDDDCKIMEQNVLQPNTFGTYTQQKEVGDETYYQIAPHQWVRSSDVVIVENRPKNKQSELWQMAPIDFTAVVKIPDNMQVVLWQINPQTLAQNKLDAHVVDNGTELKIDSKIMIAGELFYHIVNGNWIRSKYVTRKS
ncbi:hypothetical protein DS832_03505 [Bombilactobacillus bombi]|uniref:MucBP domain-containing protein n=1 Tax=Bombilactobacillus bombi TaxID=1303590 RepID=A0A3R6YQ15_9LACO|nr:hypothetical protein [Bombilactobacillus bombi]RHW47838.1 hypothetical protein DS832_03505 [Bombilactobacillus bombi]